MKGEGIGVKKEQKIEQRRREGAKQLNRKSRAASSPSSSPIKLRGGELTGESFLGGSEFDEYHL
jgi:hypothetical protein